MHRKIEQECHGSCSEQGKNLDRFGIHHHIGELRSAASPLPVQSDKVSARSQPIA
jgi:hypothetical protein